MTYTVNENKKDGKIVKLITDGYTQLLEGPYDDYFTMIGLAESDYSSVQGLKEIKDDFDNSEDDKKWEFFAGEFDIDTKGAYLLHIDVSKCINNESDSKIAKALRYCEIYEENQVKARTSSALTIQKAFRKYSAKQKGSELY